MRRPKLFIPISFRTGRLLAMALVCCLSTAVQAREKLPEVTKDGLHLVPDTKVYAVYAKPGASLEKYTQVTLVDCYVQFKPNFQRDYNMDEIGLVGQITNQDMENMKKWMAAEFKKVFTEQLDKGGHEVVDTVGPNVLLLRPAIINLEVTAPDTMMGGMDRTYTASAGQMTLYMELYDSATSELLARVIDPEAGQNGGMMMVANRVTNAAQADQILRRWADLLNSHLGEAQQPAGN